MVQVRRRAGYGAVTLATGGVVEEGMTMEMPIEEAEAREDWEVVDSLPPVDANGKEFTPPVISTKPARKMKDEPESEAADEETVERMEDEGGPSALSRIFGGNS